MDTDSIAFRALLYRECWRQRYFGPNSYIEHADENDGKPPPDGKLVLTFIDNLTREDWYAVCLMDVADIRPGAFGLLAAEMSLRDPERFEVMLHALGDMPPDSESSWGDDINERWDAVEDAMAGFRFWGTTPAHALTDEELSRLAPAAREALDALSAGCGPTSARVFEQALGDVVAEFTPPGHRRSWPS